MPASPTGRLRFVTRILPIDGLSITTKGHGVKILQQEWRLPRAALALDGEYDTYYEYEWRDVPLLPNDPGPNC